MIGSQRWGAILGGGLAAVILALVVWGWSRASVAARDGAPGAAPGRPPANKDVEQIGENLFRVGKITVDTKARTLSLNGEINLQASVIEYLAVAERGKRHESLLLLPIEPIHLQVALILLDMEPGGGLEFTGERQTPEGRPEGPRVEITVAWKTPKKSVRVFAEDMVLNDVTRKPMQRGAWIFTGSRITKEDGFVANKERSLIATYLDTAAIINNGLPGSDDDLIWKVNTRAVPPVGTKVSVRIRALDPPKEAAPPAQ